MPPYFGGPEGNKLIQVIDILQGSPGIDGLRLFLAGAGN